MGFFSDLRADLSQAVNELIPEEASVKQPLGEDDLPDMPAGPMYDMPAPRHEKVIFHKIPEGMENVRTDWKAVVNEVTSANLSSEKIVSENLSSDGGRPSAGDHAGMSERKGSEKNPGTQRDPSVGGAANLQAENEDRGMTVLRRGTVITGEITGENGVKLEEGAVLIGNLTAASAVIAGAVKGDIDVKGPVVLKPTAVVVGNIRFKSVRIDTGAVIEGMCSQCYSDVKASTIFESLQKDREEKK